MEPRKWPVGSYRIFISYSREDARDFAIRLRDDLADAGHDAWLDLSEIEIGASWSRDIEEAIEGCDIVLALLSQGSYVSDICRAEQLRSLRKGKRVIPILTQPDADRPLHLENLNYVDFSSLMDYEVLFDGLVEYILTGQVPTFDKTETRPEVPLPPLRRKRQSIKPIEEKRDARAFRRYLTDLREEPWLDNRHWWTYFLFYYADVNDIAAILQEGVIDPSVKGRSRRRRPDRWDRMVRLNFRPRTPELFGCEGIRPIGQRPSNHCAIPVYLLFDLEAIIIAPDARFSEGDVTQNNKSFKGAPAFRDLPFDLIYHDSWFHPDERDEVLNARRAQVILPRSLDLTYLQYIWCRSEAERETLLALLPGAMRDTWEEHTMARREYELFNRKWVYVEAATLMPEGLHFTFNRCQSPDAADCGPFTVCAEVETQGGEVHVVEVGDVTPDDGLALDLTGLSLQSGYSVRLYLDDALAYVGRCSG